MTLAQSFVAVLCWLLVLVAPTRVSASFEDASLLGEWTGSFVCDGVKRGATVSFTKVENRRSEGEFTFYNPGQESRPIGRFVVFGFPLSNGKARISPGRWILKASGYPDLSFAVQRSEDTRQLKGQFYNLRCSEMELAFSKPLDVGQPEPQGGDRGVRPGQGRTRPINRPSDDAMQLDCSALPTPGERSDCDHMARYRLRIGGTQSKPGRFANRELIEACRTAYAAMDPIKTPECYSGLAAIGGWPMNMKKFAEGSPACLDFAIQMRRLIQANFPLRDSSWRTYPALDCGNVDRILEARGITTQNSCVRVGGDWSKELAGCSGYAEKSTEFRNAWLEALSQCRSGQPIALYTTIKSVRADRKLNDLLEFGCADVISVVTKYELASTDEIAAARKDIDAIEPSRPPREDDLIRALKMEMSSQYQCFDNRTTKTPEKFFRCSVSARLNPSEAREIEKLDDYLKRTVPETGGSAVPTVRFSLQEVVLNSCQRVSNGFSCSFDVAMRCNVSGASFMDRPELDIISPAVTPIACQRYVEPRSRTEIFRRQGNGFEIVRGR